MSMQKLCWHPLCLLIVADVSLIAKVGLNRFDANTSALFPFAHKITVKISSFDMEIFVDAPKWDVLYFSRPLIVIITIK